MHLAILHHLAGAHLHAFGIKRAAAFAAQHKGVFADLDVFGENLLAQTIEQKAAFAIQCAAAGSLHKRAQQPSSQRRFKQHGAFGSGDFARAQAA